MSGLEISIEISDNLDQALARASAAAIDQTPAMGEIARFLASEAQERFRTQTGPDGVPWRQSLRVTGYVDRHGNRVEGDGGQTLTLSGDLRRSIKPDWGADYAAAGPEASGGAAVYARIHQEGGRITARESVLQTALRTPFGHFAAVVIPKREYLGWNEASEAEVLHIVGDHIALAFAGDAS